MTSQPDLSAFDAAAVRESARVAAVRALHLLDGPLGAGVRDIAALAAEVCGVPTAVVNIFDDSWQTPVVSVGADLSPVPRGQAMCNGTVIGGESVVVADASHDPRFSGNPFVTGDIAALRFYASVPLVTGSEHVLGTLCVYDDRPRDIDGVQRRLLEALGHQLVSMFEAREAALRAATAAEVLAAHAERAGRARVVAEECWRVAFAAAPIGMAVFDLDGPRPALLDANPAYRELTGLELDPLRRAGDVAVTHPDDRAATEAALVAVVAGGAERLVVPRRFLRPDGTEVPTRVTMSVARAADAAYLIFQVEIDGSPSYG